MTCRIEDGVTYQQSYNAENRISAIVKRDGDCETGTFIESWSYVYDGDGVSLIGAGLQTPPNIDRQVSPAMPPL